MTSQKDARENSWLSLDVLHLVRNIAVLGLGRAASLLGVQLAVVSCALHGSMGEEAAVVRNAAGLPAIVDTAHEKFLTLNESSRALTFFNLHEFVVVEILSVNLLHGARSPVNV